MNQRRRHSIPLRYRDVSEVVALLRANPLRALGAALVVLGVTFLAFGPQLLMLLLSSPH